MSKASKIIVGTAVVGGAAAAIYYVAKSRGAATDAIVPATQTTTTTTTVTEEIDYGNTQETLPGQTSRTGNKAVDAESGIKVNAPSPTIQFEGIELLKYDTSIEAPVKASDGAEGKPLNWLLKHRIEIPFAPKLGLAKDLDDMGNRYQPLGTIVGQGVIKTRRENIELIKGCLQTKESLKTRADDNLRERLAILCRLVVEGAFKYWKWRGDWLKNNTDKFSIYVVGKNSKAVKDKRGQKIKKTGAALAAAEKAVKGLYQLTDLDKQRIAANVLWAVHQRFDQNEDRANTLNKVIDLIVSYNGYRASTVPKAGEGTVVRCSDRYFRAIVDAFYDGCFNCEVPGAVAPYWLSAFNLSEEQMREGEEGFDTELYRRNDLSWIAGVVFRGKGFSREAKESGGLFD